MEPQENTELIDISDVSEALPIEKVNENEPEDFLQERSVIATLRDRFAAFFIDCIIFFYVYFFIGMIARRAFYGSWEGPIPFYGWQGLATHGFFLFVFFMYYFLFEGVFFTTAGKFFCWMYVRKKNGDLASMSSIFLRNILRFVDYAIPLFPIFLMELTKRHQRLGDLLAGTVVIRKRGSNSSSYNVTMANISKASGRMVSSAIDISIALLMTAGFLLNISPDYPALSKWLLLFSPLLPFLYFVTSESLSGTSPGKWIFGHVISNEDGVPVSFSSSVVRTFLRLFDLNPVGLLAMWLSPKRQRLGDLAADTVVSKQKRKWHGGAALLAWTVGAIAIFWFGWQNPKNFLSSEFRFNFLPTIELMGSLAEESAYKSLTITHIRFAAGDVNTIRTPATFQPGETIYIISDVYGYQKSGRMVWIQEDLDIRYPDLSIGLHQENIVDYHQVIPKRGPVELTNSIKLPLNMQNGTYVVTLTVRDLFGHENAVMKQNFEIRAPSNIETAPVPTTPAIPTPSLNAPPPNTELPLKTNNPPATKTPEGIPGPSL